MFQNKNWLKVLVPELMMVVVTLAVFFGCHQWFGMEDKEAAAFAVAAFVAIAFATVAATFATAFAATTAFVAITAVAAADATTTFVAITAVAATVVTTVAAIAVAIAVAAAFAVKEYKLPKFWVFASYLVEVVIIFFPIYLSS